MSGLERRLARKQQVWNPLVKATIAKEKTQKSRFLRSILVFPLMYCQAGYKEAPYFEHK